MFCQSANLMLMDRLVWVFLSWLCIFWETGPSSTSQLCLHVSLYFSYRIERDKRGSTWYNPLSVTWSSYPITGCRSWIMWPEPGWGWSDLDLAESTQTHSNSTLTECVSYVSIYREYEQFQWHFFVMPEGLRHYQKLCGPSGNLCKSVHILLTWVRFSADPWWSIYAQLCTITL